MAPRPELPDQTALPAGVDAPLDRALAPQEALHPGASAFRLVSDGPEAFALRARTAQLAGRSIDVQTYIWHPDLTGGYLAFQLLAAADRGVRVRLLVDDLDARTRSYGFAALAAHPLIEVRVFNPFRTRGGGLPFALEAVANFRRINRRMHNKTWIVDNRLAIVGGRNLGDEYFGASDEVNFVDLDFALVGPIVRDVSAAFDEYWNSPGAYPIEVLSPDPDGAESLARLRDKLLPLAVQAAQSPFARQLKSSDAVQRLVSGDWPVEWSTEYRMVADDPLKAYGRGEGIGGSRVLEVLSPAITAARSDLTIISPYFVPGKEGTAGLTAVAGAGPRIRILTNSLAANDVAAVYGGYVRSRRTLLEAGILIWELKPQPGTSQPSSLFGSSGASLHTKALVVDDSIAFVGSFNLDPRSASLNTEQGVFVRSEPIARQLSRLFDEDTAGTRAWQVLLTEQGVEWRDDETVLTSTPATSAWRRCQAWLARILPVTSQL